MARFATFSLLTLILLGLPAGASAQLSSGESSMSKALKRQIRAAGSHSGAYVVNATENRGVFRSRADRARVLASNTKLFTTAAALARYGSAGRLATTVQRRGQPRGRRHVAGLAVPGGRR